MHVPMETKTKQGYFLSRRATETYSVEWYDTILETSMVYDQWI